MKKLLSLLLLILIGCSSPEPINIDTMLIERNGVYFTRGTNQPYSGPVFSLLNGVLSQEIVLKDGKFHGLLKNYNYVGQLTWYETYKNGELDGPYKSYYEDGQLEEEGTYKNGELDGPFKIYNYNGVLKRVENYKNGELIDKEY